MTDRAEFSRKTKALAFERAKGRCQSCKNKIIAANGPAQYDHIIPAAVGGSNELDNCQVLCKRPCHDLKTHATDVPEIAKTKRIRDKHTNAKGKSQRGFKGWRNFKGEAVFAKDRR